MPWPKSYSDGRHGQLKSAWLSGFSFNDISEFFSSVDLLSATAQSSLELRLTPLQALHDTSNKLLSL